MSVSMPATIVSPYVTSLLFSQKPLTSAQLQYLNSNYSITSTAENTVVTKQADGMLLAKWQGPFALASSSTDYTISYYDNQSTDRTTDRNVTATPNNVPRDNSPGIADVAKVISGAAKRNDEFSLLDTFFKANSAAKDVA